MLTEAAIRDATDTQSFTRGQQYFASGRVLKLAVDGSRSTAQVTYRVSSP